MKLFDYQEESVAFVGERKKVYLALDMGLGKTIIGLTAAIRYGKKNVLVIAEKNEIVNSKNFEREVEDHFPEVSYVSLRGMTALDGFVGRVVAGANPEILEKFTIKELQEYFDSVIVDEATLAKTATSTKFKNVKKVCKAMEYVILLSGTPMMNGASEIFAPLVLLDHPLAGDGSAKARMAFEKIFAGGCWIRLFGQDEEDDKAFWKGKRWDAKGANHLRELRLLTEDKFLFKRKDETGVFHKKERLMEYVHVTPEWDMEYKQAWEDYLKKVEEENLNAMTARKWNDMKSISTIKELRKLIENGQVYQVNSRWKAKQVVEDIARGTFGEQRIIVFSMFIETDQMIQDMLKERDISFSTFNDLEYWKESDDKVLVGRIKSHSKGGNVPEASVTLFVDMDFVPANNLQAEGRMDRPQQTRDMLVRYYMVDDTSMVDYHVRKIVANKIRKVNEFMRPFADGEREKVHLSLAELKKRYPKDFELLV